MKMGAKKGGSAFFWEEQKNISKNVDMFFYNK